MRSTERRRNRRNCNEEDYQSLWVCNPDFFATHLCVANSSQQDRYEGLIDLRSTLSDGAHTIEELVQMARSRGIFQHTLTLFAVFPES
jgi:hypothetical protein